MHGTDPELRRAPRWQRLQRRIAALGTAAAIALGAADLAHGQAPRAVDDDAAPVAPPSEYSDKARRAYAQGLSEARDLLVKQQPAAAVDRIDVLLKERPRESQARFLKSVALTDLGKRDEAVTVLLGIVADYPELPEPHNNLAVLYAAKGEYDAARSELALAIAIQPSYGVAHENLGDVYARLAAAEYERAGELDRTNKTAATKLKLARDITAPPKPAP